MNGVLSIYSNSYDDITESNGFKTNLPATTKSAYGCDVNGDGHEDLVQLTEFNMGLVVYYGPLSKYKVTSHLKINGTNGFKFYNYMTLSEPICGDLNGDGFDDIAFYSMDTLKGKIIFIYGTNQTMSPSFSILDGNNGFYINSDGTNNAFGYGKSFGDINGDSISDLIISTCFNCYIGATGTKGVFVMYGINGGKFPVNSQIIYDVTTRINQGNGFKIPNFEGRNIIIGDFNNDQIDDIIVNSPQLSNVYLYVIYGRREPFPLFYTPAYDGIDGVIITVRDSQFLNQIIMGDLGDFNNDGLIDFLFQVSKGKQILVYMIYGKKEYQANIELNLSSFNGTNDGLVFYTNTNSWCASPRFKDVNGDDFADFVCAGNSVTKVIFGNNFKYNISVVNVDQVILSEGICSGISILNSTSNYISIGDFNSSNINGIVSGNSILYGSKYIGSISFINSTIYLQSIESILNDGIYKIFENNIITNPTDCAITLIKLNIGESIQGDKFIIDNSSFSSLLYSATIKNDTSLLIELKERNNSLSLVNDVLKGISVSLSLQHSNRTISLKYDYDIEVLVILGEPIIECLSECLNGGICNDFIGECECIGDYYGIDCGFKNCSLNCLNGGTCNTTIGECLCIDGFYGINCGIKNCSVDCLNGGLCNTSIGECLCVDEFYGINCGVKNCSVDCLNGGLCNTTIGQCSCIDEFYDIDCGLKNCRIDCLNGGICNTTIGECNCVYDFYGSNCGIKNCSVDCLNGGTCDKIIGQCQCIDDFYGSNCSVKDCSMFCLNNGTCNTTIGQCNCNHGFEGNDCSGISCPIECLNGTICNTTIGICVELNSNSNSNSNSSEQIGVVEGANQRKKKVNIGIIVGSVVGGCVFIAVAIFAFIFLKKRFQLKKNPSKLKKKASMYQVFIGGSLQNIDKF